MSSLVCHSNTFSGNSVQHLIARIRTLRQELRANLVQLRGLSFRLKSSLSSATEDDIFHELLSTNLLALLMVSRLLSAIGDVQKDELEHDALLYASEIKSLEEEMISIHGWANFYLYQKATSAASIAATRCIWEAAPGKIIDNWRFSLWCRAIQRHTCCN